MTAVKPTSVTMASYTAKISRNIFVLLVCNGVGISIAVASVTISALAARQIGWNGALSTIPYGTQFLFTMLAILPAPQVMQRYGRKVVFQCAAGLGALGGCLASFSMELSLPIMLALGHALIGVCLAAVNLFRFAAIDLASDQEKARVMSIVVFGGTFAALLGPSIVRYSDDVFVLEQFSATYLGIATLSALVACLLFNLKARPVSETRGAVAWGTYFGRYISFKSIGGTLTAAVSYGVMNFLMLSGAIAMAENGFGHHHITTVIQFHVLAMFLPAIFMGRLIQVFGAEFIVICGALISLSGMILAVIMGSIIYNFFSTLVLAGLSWNMLYVAGSFIATHASDGVAEYNAQSCNEFVIGVFAIFGAFMPGWIMAKFSWAEVNAILIVPVLVFYLLGLGLMFFKERG